MSKAFKASTVISRETFSSVASDGVAVFFGPDRLYQGGIPPLDGPGTFRLDERTCALRLSNQRNNETLKANNPDLYEFDLNQTRTALLAVQAFKKQKGLSLDTPDIANAKQGQTGPRLSALNP